MNRHARISTGALLVAILLVAGILAPSAPSASASTPPGGWAAQYYPNATLSGSPVLTRNDPSLDFDWGVNGTPDPSVPTVFSARWTGSITTVAGLYRFDSYSDDGVRVYVDGALVIDHFVPQAPTEWQASVNLTAGSHTVVMEYEQLGGGAVARLSYGLIDPTAPTAGAWKAEFFANQTLSQLPVLVRSDTTISNDWGLTAPDPGLPSTQFSARWTQTLTLPAGTYRFNTSSDDGIRVFVDGTPVINDWTPHSLTTDTGDLALTAGSHTFVVEYFQAFGTATAKMNWASLPGPGVTRINTGGPAYIDSHHQYWSADTDYSGGVTSEEFQPIWNTDDGTLYYNEHAAPTTYTIPTPNGSYVVRLHFAELYFNSPGVRRFNVAIQGQPVLSSFDIYGTAGKATLETRSFPATVTNGALTIDFSNVFDNAAVQAIDVVPAGQFDTTAPVFTPIPEAENATFSTTPAVTLGVTDDVQLHNGYWRIDDQAPQPLFTNKTNGSYGAQFTMPTAAFNALGLGSHMLSFGADDTAGNATVQTWHFRKLNTGGGSVPIAFNQKTILSQASPLAPSLHNPTSLNFGPDGKLYETNLDGYIHVLTLDANHNVVQVTRIDTIHDTPNINPDGTAAPSVTGRHLIGLTFDPASTPDHPIIWVVHSDPRFCFNQTPTTCSINTDSGILTRLDGPSFELPANRHDVVTGLPRSRENHSPNSIHFGPDGWLYMAIGSDTNFGAPSLAFSGMPERYLTDAIVRLNVHGSAGSFPFDARGIVSAAGMTPGVFEMYATGYRNTYDFLFHSNGQLYANTNRGNFTAGNTPGPADGCPSGVSFDPGTRADDLSIVNSGDYGGNPNPVRGECVLEDGQLYSPPLPKQANYHPPIMYYGPNGVSADGMTEYKAPTFGGQMQGNILSVMWAGDQALKRVVLSNDGQSVLFQENLGIFNQPLGVAASTDGTIFVGEYGSNDIVALEPASPLTGKWDVRPNAPVATAETATTACGGKIFMVGGLINPTTDTNAAWAYDPSAQTWTQIASYPGQAVDHAGISCINGTVYLVGGLIAGGTPVSDVRSYSPGTNTWTVLANLPQPRGASGVSSLNGLIYVAGGLGYPSKTDLYRYDPVANAWSTLASMPTARDHVTLQAAAGHLYAIGGRFDSLSTTMGTNEVYDPTTNTWATRSPLPVPSSGMSSGALDGKIQVWGGEAQDAGGNGIVRTTGYQYDPGTDTWIPIAGEITPRHGTTGATLGNEVYVMNGSPASSGASNTNEVFTFIDNMPPVSCIAPGTDPRVTDSDGDGFTDQDEADNSTDPCNPSSVPPDHNHNHVSDLNDPNDDSDLAPDGQDQVQFDPQNGGQTPIPFALSFNPTDPPPGTGTAWDTGGTDISFGNSGFPGWQLTSHGTGFLTHNVHEGGAGGFLSLDATAGTSQGATNSQDDALQVAYDATHPATIRARVATPFNGLVIDPGKKAGIFAGLDEDNYVQFGFAADNGTGHPGLVFSTESAASFTLDRSSTPVNLDFTPVQTLDLALDLNPADHTIRARYRINSDLDSDWQVAGVIDVSADAHLLQLFRKAGDPATSTAIPWSGGSLAGVFATKGTALTPFGVAYKSFGIDPYTPTSSVTPTSLALTSSAQPTALSKPVTYTATVTPAPVGGTVGFTDNGTAIAGCATVAVSSAGTASCTTSPSSLGSHPIAATYSGNAGFGPSLGTFSQSVAWGTTTTVTSSPATSVFGQSVTVTATVKVVAPGTGTPTGTVTFTEGSTVLGTGTLSSGKAKLITRALAVGTHKITATYAGSSTYAGSANAPAYTQTVNVANTTTTVTGSPTTSVHNHPVTFTATVKPISPGTGTPDGSVTFLDGATVLGTVALSSGKATLTVSSLTVGSHTITASYPGAASFGPSSGTTTQLVTANTTIAVGAAGAISTSPDGTTWTPRTSGTTQNLAAATWTGTTAAVGSYLVVGDAGTVLTSPDGIVWTSRVSGTTKSLASVTWNGSKFVAVGSAGAVLTSTDGAKWTVRTSGTTLNLTSVVWNGAQFVAVGSGGKILTSPTGVTWTSRASGTTANLAGVTWNGSSFVTVGATGTVLTSPNGTTWTTRTSGVTAGLAAVAWSGSSFVVVGGSGSVITSPDGVTWTTRTSGTASDLTAVVWAGSGFLAMGSGGATTSSADGIAWTAFTLSPATSMRGLVYGQ